MEFRKSLSAHIAVVTGAVLLAASQLLSALSDLNVISVHWAVGTYASIVLLAIVGGLLYALDVSASRSWGLAAVMLAFLYLVVLAGELGVTPQAQGQSPFSGLLFLMAGFVMPVAVVAVACGAVWWGVRGIRRRLRD